MVFFSKECDNIKKNNVTVFHEKECDVTLIEKQVLALYTLPFNILQDPSKNDTLNNSSADDSLRL